MRKSLLIPTALYSLLPTLSLADEEEFTPTADLIAERPSPSHWGNEEDGYTINFNNVSAAEYVRFVSKILNVNFIFDEEELSFPVTIVSEEPISAKNILSALVQVLRIHDLTLLEQENNFLITKSNEVNQIPAIVSEEFTDPGAVTSALVTRIFQIKNAQLDTIISILRPMTSAAALMEVSKETRQLIITDITTNLDKIASLLISLDTPHSPLSIESFVARNTSPAELIVLATQIVGPFAEGNPLIFIPQLHTNTIFIVSTPFLIDKAKKVMDELDVSKKDLIVTNDNIFIYKIQYRSATILLDALHDISEELTDVGNAPSLLTSALNNGKWIKESNSLLFIADNEAIAKIKDLLSNLDTPGSAATSFYLYPIKHTSKDNISEALEGISDNIKNAGIQDPALMHAIASMTWIPETNALLFTGDPASLAKLQTLLASIDMGGPGALELDASAQTVFLYQLLHAKGRNVIDDLKKIASNLRNAGFANPALVHSLEHVQWIEESNTLLITGSEEIIDQVRQLIVRFDTPVGLSRLLHFEKSSFFIYKPIYRPAEQIQQSLKDIAIDLQSSGLIDKDLLETLSSANFVPSTHSILFTGTPASLDKLKELLVHIDTPQTGASHVQTIGGLTFLIYKIQYSDPTQLMSSLKSVVTELETSNSLDRDLVQTIKTMKWIRETNSILFTGLPSGLEKAEALAQKFDVPGGSGTPSAAADTERSTSHFIIYEPQYRTGDELIAILHNFEQNLMQSGVTDPALFDTIDNLRWICDTNSLIVSGDQASVTRVRDLLSRFDSPEESDEPAGIESINQANFLIYKLQYHRGEEIQTALKQVAAQFPNPDSPTNKPLIDAINSIQWIEMTNSLLSSGDQDVLTKLRDLIQNLDVPLRQVFIEVLVIETTLSNAQNFGLQWGGKLQFLNKIGAGTGNFPGTNPATGTANGTLISPLNAVSATAPPTPTTIPPITGSQGFDLGVIGDIIMHKGKSFLSLGSLVNALQTDFDSTVVMNPKIITQDNNNSTFFVGQNIPFTGSLVNTSGGINTTVSANVEYRDVGLNLSITPVLGNNDVITLDISNDITAQIDSTTTVNNLPINGIQTSHTSLTTRVHLPNNHFLALSGMISDTKTRFRSQIPCLGGIPVIGLAFSEHDRLDSKDNIIIFVRPHIIDSTEEYRQLTEYQENMFKGAASMPVLKEEFDAGVDMIKTPENESP